MCPITTTNRIRKIQSCTNVAPVRHERGNGLNHRMIEPVASITRDGAGDERGVELLARVELAHPASPSP